MLNNKDAGANMVSCISQNKDKAISVGTHIMPLLVLRVDM